MPSGGDPRRHTLESLSLSNCFELRRGPGLERSWIPRLVGERSVRDGSNVENYSPYLRRAAAVLLHLIPFIGPLISYAFSRSVLWILLHLHHLCILLFLLCDETTTSIGFELALEPDGQSFFEVTLDEHLRHKYFAFLTRI